jgi:hypothetical protein
MLSKKSKIEAANREFWNLAASFDHLIGTA